MHLMCLEIISPLIVRVDFNCIEVMSALNADKVEIIFLKLTR